MTFSLHEIRAQIDRLLAECPELADDDVLKADMVEGCTDLFDYLRKVERTRRQTFTHSVALEMEIKLLQERKARFERRDESLRKALFNAMQWAELKKAELPEATLSIRAGQQKVIITDESAIPKEFCRVRVEPDKTIIRDTLRAGNHVPGAELSNAESVLAIRIK